MAPKLENPFRLKAQIFYALSDPLRLEILEFIRDGEKCVCEIVPYLNLIQPVVSRHLKILKDSGLVLDRKEGNKRLYSVTDKRVYRIIDEINPPLADFLAQKILDQTACR